MSKPAAPPPSYHAAGAQLSSSKYATNWLSAGFINDKLSANCQTAQGRQFLCTGVRPAIGQRVELTIFLTSSQREGVPFRLSGEVVNDRISTMPPYWEGLGVATDDNTSAQYGAPGVVSASSSSLSSGSNCNDTYHNPAWRPSTSEDDCGVNGGSMALANLVRAIMVQQEPSLLTNAPANLMSVWENNFSIEKKEEVANIVVKKLGALHGHKVVCEARLNFDYDMRRGLEEGPWIDGIPFDGRDIWQFTLVADDSKECMWRADPLSFVNLGPVHRPRCWPWSNDNALPYQRTGIDKPVRGPGPNGAISVHTCIGPHGCRGNDHTHSFQSAQAA